MSDENGQDKDPFDFSDLETIEIPVKIKKREFVLREACAKAKADYDNALMSNAIMNKDKSISMGKTAEAELILVRGCLFEVTQDDKGNKSYEGVSQGFVNSLPHRVTAPLFDKIKEISEMSSSEEEEEESKNEESGDSSPMEAVSE